MNDLQQAWRLHPLFRGLLFVATFIVVWTMLTSLMPPAWAAISIPVTDKITITLGDLPPWIAAVVAALGLWKAWRAEQRAADAANKAAAANSKIEAVAVQIDGLLVDRDKAKVIEGETKGEQAGLKTAQSLAQGQREGREAERASVAAQTPTPALAVDASSETPVKDKRVAVATERMADAAERSSDAGERVAKATEEKS